MAAMGNSLKLGFDAGATNIATIANTSVATLTDGTKVFLVQPTSGIVGAAGSTLGCIFLDTAITGTLNIDIAYYDVLA